MKARLYDWEMFLILTVAVIVLTALHIRLHPATLYGAYVLGILAALGYKALLDRRSR
jgi:uncharacterized membrane protein